MSARWWYSGFAAGMGFQLVLQMYAVTPHIHRAWWVILYWFGIAVIAALVASGVRLVVRRASA